MHPDLIAYRARIVAELRKVPGLTVYDGEVPDTVPTDSAGFIRPYTVLFATDGDPIDERDMSGALDLTAARWDFQTTTVAATAGICSQAGYLVRLALTNLPVGTGLVLPSPQDYGVAPIKDTNISPARYFIPRMWRLETT